MKNKLSFMALMLDLFVFNWKIVYLDGYLRMRNAKFEIYSYLRLPPFESHRTRFLSSELIPDCSNRSF